MQSVNSLPNTIYGLLMLPWALFAILRRSMKINFKPIITNIDKLGDPDSINEWNGGHIHQNNSFHSNDLDFYFLSFFQLLILLLCFCASHTKEPFDLMLHCLTQKDRICINNLHTFRLFTCTWPKIKAIFELLFHTFFSLEVAASHIFAVTTLQFHMHVKLSVYKLHVTDILCYLLVK